MRAHLDYGGVAPERQCLQRLSRLSRRCGRVPGAPRRVKAGVPGVTPERSECTRAFVRYAVICQNTAKCMRVWTIMYAHDVRSGHEHVRGHHIGVPARPPRPLCPL